MSREMKPILSKFFENVENGSAFVAFILSFILMLLVSVNVILRYVFASPITGVVEVTELLMVPIVFMPLAFAEKSGGHIRADLLYIKVQYPYKGVLEVLIYGIGFAICTIFVLQTFRDAWAAYQINDITPGHVKIVTWPIRLTIPIGFSVLAVRFLSELILKSASRR